MDCVIRTWDMLTNFFLPIIDDMDVSDMWFQEDSATCYTATESFNLLRKKFSNKIIPRNSAVNSPPRSCDLTPLDNFLWGYLKGQVYADNPQSIEASKTNIRDA